MAYQWHFSSTIQTLLKNNLNSMDKVRTPFIQDIPQSFFYISAKGKSFLVGVYGQIVRNFAAFHNYKLQLDHVVNPSVSEIQKNIEQGIYNLSMKAGIYGNLFANITFSYPVEWSKSCIMVPAKEELPRFWYVVWPFGPYIWGLLHFAVLYVAFYMRFLRHPSAKFFHNLLTSLAVVIYSSNMNLKVINVSFRVQYFYSILLISGFIISSYYSSYLAMYNMRPVFQPCLKTIDDILEAGIKVLVPSRIFEELRNTRFLDLSRLESVLIEKTQLEVTERIKIFDRLYAYVINHNEWVFTAKLQRNLIQPLFQLSDICFGNVLSAIPVGLESKFAPALNHFILLVHQSGLWLHWQEEAYQSAVWANYYRPMEDEYPAEPLNLNFFRFAWAIFFAGTVLSCICFLVERLVFKYNKNKF